jgi:hypothetical protein
MGRLLSVLTLVTLMGGSSLAADWLAPEPWPQGRPKVLLIGDSNVYGPTGEFLQNQLVAHGYAVWRRGKPGSGLSLPNHYDWAQAGREMVARVKPQVVILQIGGNDTLAVRPLGWHSPRILFKDAAAWRPAYEARVREVLSGLIGEGRKVFLLSPTNRGRNLEKVKRVRDAQREAAKSVPGVTFVDMFPLTSDEDGRFLYAIEDGQGQRLVLRRPDLIHFNDAGGAVVAGRVLKTLSSLGLVLH